MTQSIESMIEVLQAYQAGKRIEYRCEGNIAWHEAGSPNWNFDTIQYRIAPEPKKKVKLEAWFGENKRLIWVEKGFYEKSPPFWTRVPSEDKEVEI